MTQKPWIIRGITSKEFCGAFATKSAAVRAANRRNRAIDAGQFNSFLVTMEKVEVVARSTEAN